MNQKQKRLRPAKSRRSSQTCCRLCPWQSMHCAACFGERRMVSCDAEKRENDTCSWKVLPYMKLRFVRPESTVSMSYDWASWLLRHAFLLPSDSIDQHACLSGKHLLSHHNRLVFRKQFSVLDRWSIAEVKESGSQNPHERMDKSRPYAYTLYRSVYMK